MLTNRRQLLQALGLGAVSGLLAGRRLAHAETITSPSRIVFYVQPHGHVPNAWTMAIPNGATDVFAARSLGGLTADEMCPSLRALHPFRDRLLAIEGLSHTASLADIAAVTRAGSGDLNNHQIAVADLLTGSRALQRGGGAYCAGGATSIDQVLAVRTGAPGRFGSRVYGFDYIPNSMPSPFSYLRSGAAAPVVSNPKTAFSDLIGYTASSQAIAARTSMLQAQRPSVLDAVAVEYALLAPTLGTDGHRKLIQHREFVHDLEMSLGVIGVPRVGAPARCASEFDPSGHVVRQFMRVIRLALACDLTRVVTFLAPVPQCAELGYPGSETVHGYAHQSILGSTSCGQMYNPVAERAMTDLDAWHAAHLAYLLQELDAVPEGAGTLLDHTVVVWLTELATPTHQHHDAHVVLAGGCNGFFETGRYVRYPRTLSNPLVNQPLTGPPHNRLLVSLMQAMGQGDTSFGMTDAQAADGTTISFRGPLEELHRWR